MKTVFKVAKKALPGASIYFCIFLALAITFSFLAGADQEAKFQASEQSILVKDEDDSVLSKALLTYLAKENEVSTDFEEEKVSDLLFYGMVDYVIYIEDGFETSFLSGEKVTGLEKQSTQPNTAFLDQKIELFCGYVRGALATGKTIEEACEQVLTISDKETEIAFVGEKKSAELNPVYYFFTYVAYVFPAVLIMALGPILQAFYRKDVKMRTDCGQVTARTQNLRIVAGIFVISLVLWALILLISLVLFHKDLTVQVFLGNVLNSFLFLLVSVAISVIMGMLLKGPNALNGASNVISMGMAFLCGVFVPYQYLPNYVQKISMFLPASWYVKNTELLAGSDTIGNISEFLKNCGVIAVFAVALLCLVLVVAKRRRVA